MVSREELEQAKTSGGPARIYREGLEGGSVDGFVVGCGPVFFVMAVLDKVARLDGYSCMRYASVSKCMVPSPSTGRVLKTLRAHGEKPERPEELAAPELAQIIKFATRRFGLITIGNEDPASIFIGRVRFVSDTFMQIILLGPDADWDSGPTEFDFNEIHRVDFGGAYEQSLWRAAQGR
jgi:hypothetical protein